MLLGLFLVHSSFKCFELGELRLMHEHESDKVSSGPVPHLYFSMFCIYPILRAMTCSINLSLAR